ncbi:AraC family transcriptional regulator [Candidatus Pantoea deserta]|uniref:AraC family transcriptional regulator n=1 Tax=Candidatus Pantoea deserta TaxID=1869313 RepID=A0A3N4NHS5_9GAMM|nr:helix-turn-helix transcriptional regulator [Pantoea deserta]RPD95914.1 AraC family transcriptional regulator [Pantoea deserta]
MAIRKIFTRHSLGSTANVCHNLRLKARNITAEEPTIILVHQGIKKIYCAGQEIVVQAGQSVVVAEGYTFDAINFPSEETQTYEASWLSFSCDLIRNNVTVNPASRVVKGICALPEPTDSFFRAFSHTVEAVIDEATIPFNVALQRMQEMLSWLDAYGMFFGQQTQGGLKNKIRRLVSTNIAYEWNAHYIAKEFGLSEATLRRRLSAENTSFIRLVIDVRMCRALTLLQVTDLPINLIALEVGYQNPSKFSARFRERFGFSPGQVRTEGLSKDIHRIT